jgi:hypothetical protein
VEEQYRRSDPHPCVIRVRRETIAFDEHSLHCGPTRLQPHCHVFYPPMNTPRPSQELGRPHRYANPWVVLIVGAEEGSEPSGERGPRTTSRRVPVNVPSLRRRHGAGRRITLVSPMKSPSRACACVDQPLP